MSWRLTALKTMIVYIPVTMAINDLVVGVVRVTGDTYQDTFHGSLSSSSLETETSWVLVNRWNGTQLRNGGMEIGDIVCVMDPQKPGRALIRKVTGLEQSWTKAFDGQSWYHVHVKKGYSWLTGRSMDNDSETETGSDEKDQKENPMSLSKEVGPEETYDSMVFGPVSNGLIIGSPLFVISPFKRIGAINQSKK